MDESLMKLWTMEEVATHNTPEDMWIVLHGKVYDVTRFLEHHPGGTDIMIETAGMDVTHSFEEVIHSDQARQQTAQFHIGQIEGYVHESMTPTVDTRSPILPIILAVLFMFYMTIL
jgi:cytochrome b involved in lipid metabolism